jgi:hypothetical protein
MRRNRNNGTDLSSTLARQWEYLRKSEASEQFDKQSAYCFACDAIHPQAVRTRGETGVLPAKVSSCDGPHIKECTCARCDLGARVK